MLVLQRSGGFICVVSKEKPRHQGDDWVEANFHDLTRPGLRKGPGQRFSSTCRKLDEGSKRAYLCV
jgi:hypothetical protein